MKKMFQIKAKLLYNKRIKGDYLYCALKAPQIAHNAHPGQFVNIKLTDTFEPLLRRPFSIHRVKGSNIEILYEVVGKGTEILSQKKTGEYLDAIGPLGNGFNYKSEARSKERGVLVGGGMGVAPLLFLAEKLAEQKTIILIGAKTKNQLLCEMEFKQLGYEVKISTDDGSKGFKGRVTDLLKCLLSTIPACRRGRDYRLSTIYACGPKPMLKEINTLSKKYNVPAQISLEEHMACGIGACLGCVVKTSEGFKRVCKEGPVFNADEIIW